MDTTEKKEKLFVLLAGQSNMAGRGIAGKDDLTEIPGLVVFRPGNVFRSAVEPVTRDRKFIGTFSGDGKKIETADPWDTLMPREGEQVVGVGPGRTFGKLLLEMHPGKTVVLLPCAVGGTSIAAWLPGGTDDWDGNNFLNGGAVFADGATVNLKSGSLIENNLAMSGGGIMMNGGTLNMSGGTVKGNTAKATCSSGSSSPSPGRW